MTYIAQNIQLTPILKAGGSPTATFQFPAGIFPDDIQPSRWVATCQLYAVKRGDSFTGFGLTANFNLHRAADGTVTASDLEVSAEDEAELGIASIASGTDQITVHVTITDTWQFAVSLLIKSLSATET